MAGVDSFGAVKIDIERALEDRVNSLVEGELTVGRLSSMLGTLRAIETVTKQIAALARQGLQITAMRAAIEGRRTADENEANQARDALAALDAQESALAERHQALAAHLETLEAALRA